MTTVVNNPSQQSDKSGYGFLIGIILVIGFVSVLLYFGIPAIKNMGPIQVNVPTPEITVQSPQVVVSDKVNVEVSPTK